jgi:hypothetical protein
MRTVLVGCSLMIVVGSTAFACDPPPFAPNPITADAIVRDASFAWISAEQFSKLEASLFEKSTPSPEFGQTENICAASLAGAPVLRIRVTSLPALPHPSKESEKKQWSEAVARILKVWNADSSAAGGVFWDEYTLWSISAVIEYANGREGSLLTNGTHSKFQDTLGYHWYLRTVPTGAVRATERKNTR